MANDIYAERCNNPEIKATWEASGLVRVDTLHKGDVFEDIGGSFWTVDSRNHSGTIHAICWGNLVTEHKEDDFASCAMVRPVMRKQYTTAEA